MANLVVTSSATLNAVAGYPKMEGQYKYIHKGIVVNSEVLTFTHGTDVEGMRRVTIINATTGKDVVDQTVAVAARATSTSTTVTFGAAGAGTYTIVFDMI